MRELYLYPPSNENIYEINENCTNNTIKNKKTKKRIEYKASTFLKNFSNNFLCIFIFSRNYEYLYSVFLSYKYKFGR